MGRYFGTALSFCSIHPIIGTMHPTRLLVLSSCLLALLAACSENSGVSEPGKPQDIKDVRRESRGSLVGDGGFGVMGGAVKDDETAKSPIGVNGFLWRATLDTLSFMPINQADPFGGTVLTDWYEDPKAPGERYKVNAIILDKTLRADGIRVSVFKQKLDGTAWRDLPVDDHLARKLEDSILTRARHLRIAQLGH